METLVADGPLLPLNKPSKREVPWMPPPFRAWLPPDSAYPPVHKELNNRNIRRQKVPPATAHLTQLAPIVAVLQSGCPAFFIQHHTIMFRELVGSKQPESAKSRFPAVLPRETTIRHSKDFLLHGLREPLHKKGRIHAAAGATCAP